MSTITIDWIKSLASNDYHQGTGSMAGDYIGSDDWSDTKATAEFCCMGVRRFMECPSIPEDDGEAVLDSAEPDEWERKEYGLTYFGQVELINLNDTEEYTFPEIALEMLKRPKFFFVPEVAEEVISYFVEGDTDV